MQQTLYFLNRENSHGAKTENPKTLFSFFHSGSDKTSVDTLFWVHKLSFIYFFYSFSSAIVYSKGHLVDNCFSFVDPGIWVLSNPEAWKISKKKKNVDEYDLAKNCFFPQKKYVCKILFREWQSSKAYKNSMI